MVQIKRASKRNQIIQKQLRAHQTVLNRHYLNLFILMVIGLTIALYFYLLGIEQKAAAMDTYEESLLNHQPLHLKSRQEVETDGDGVDDGILARMITEDLIDRILPAHLVIANELPFLVYGTAWKKQDTARYVQQAVHAGFRFIDTACQPKHYNEKGVGEGWTAAAAELQLERSDLYLQTKYTPFPGQDPHNIPYDPEEPIEEQVRQSLRVSLENLQTDYLDAWVMHSPLDTIEDTMVAYRTMEEAVDEEKVERLGISNCYHYDVFVEIFNQARIKPSILQNRFQGETHFDVRLRDFCRENGIWYQSFWTLTARPNRDAIRSSEAKELASSRGLTPETLMYAYVMSLGYGRPLDGTRSQLHMDEDISLMKRMQKYVAGVGEERPVVTDQDLAQFEGWLGIATVQ